MIDVPFLSSSAVPLRMSSLIHPIPALAFESPWLLTGLVLAAVPIILHLFFRRPHREIPWAATRFLLSATKKHAPRIRLEQLLLLALRVLLLVLIVVALARPNSGDSTTAFDPETGLPAGRRIILVLDASYSMAHQVGGESRFDRARGALRAVVESARPGDAFQLLRMTNLGPNIVIGEPSFQASLVAETLDEQKISHGRAAVWETLQAIKTLLAKHPSNQPARIVIASDFQRADWLGDETASDRLPSLLEEIREQAAISLADAAITPNKNQAITSLELDGPLVRIGRPARFSATIAGHGLDAAQSRRVDLEIDQVPAVTDTLSITPDRQTTITLQDTLTEPGPHGLELRLPPDALNIDNSRFLAVEAIDRLRVLLVDGTPGRDAEQRGTFFLKRALAPASGGSAANESDFAPTIILDSELATAELSQCDVVLLANVELLTEPEVARLRAFANSGGGVVIALGDQVSADVYNRVLTGKSGLLPVHFEERIGDPTNPERALAFSTSSLEHPITRPFVGNPGTGLETDFVLAYMRTTFDPASAVRGALEFESGDPAILTAPLGDGRVVLLTTSAGLSWAGPWPQIGRSYLPLMHEMLRFAATGRQQSRRVRVGDPLLWTLPDRIAGLTATVTGPDDLSRELPLRVAPSGTQARFEETFTPGIYTISMGSPVNREALFAVNVDPNEGDLASLSEQERNSLIPGSTPLEMEAAAPRIAPASRTWPISRWLLALALGALLVEQVMAWRFRQGLKLLLATVVVFLCFALWRIAMPWMAIALLVVAVALATGWLWRRRGL